MIALIFSALLLAIANKCFSLIYHLPDNVFSWIGGQPDRNQSVEQDMQLVESYFQSGVKKVNEQITLYANQLGNIKKLDRSDR